MHHPFGCAAARERATGMGFEIEQGREVCCLEKKMKMKTHYDVVITGSGLGGLVASIILAREGYSVCVLEKNNQYGGNLQTFVRDKTIFDTGIHYIGGLDKGQNLYKYFQYIGIMDALKLHKMDEDGFDIISFEDTRKSFRMPRVTRIL
jgi:monoamine oxidase